MVSNGRDMLQDDKAGSVKEAEGMNCSAKKVEEKDMLSGELRD